MNFSVRRTKRFTRSFKRLNKRYKKLADDYKKLVDVLEVGNHNAIEITKNIYKIRLQNTSNPKGKSGGFRVVYFLKTKENTLYLLDIFSKNEISSIKKDKLIQMALEQQLITK
ncbi:hypothetical protein THERMOT_181 [Bathymodiolus thermophilus thioautotrophic gill symbiont]|uniref:type II toxin-antitoxin system RelE/ParE family toxin n=1 Tax=Bathymodiolus thermophilus thioautotrophic gill symbiont TaxID=2360 RepID=UPI00192BFC1A|nr:type II toxin-antitoxin system RelE/ParE family toxin [Bathymodiolus thermophilus thioautotrophic gill symbiont]CAB5494841.1 hypothetical protein THERMOT_181 [Bathymodiolus thermophilus thioautotrophic gill symbiont]